MSNIWVVSDTHFNHSNILKFTDSASGALIRPGFSSVEEMNELMIQRWNECVRPGDKVYHLGDVVMGTDQEGWMKRHWPRLMGRKVLICGNHDPIKLLASGGWFSSIYESRDLRDLGLLLTHRPAHESQLWDWRRDRAMLNCHGHIHQQDPPSNNHYNVCVEKTSYYPINIDELRLY